MRLLYRCASLPGCVLLQTNRFNEFELHARSMQSKSYRFSADVVCAGCFGTEVWVRSVKCALTATWQGGRSRTTRTSHVRTMGYRPPLHSDRALRFLAGRDMPKFDLVVLLWPELHGSTPPTHRLPPEPSPH